MATKHRDVLVSGWGKPQADLERVLRAWLKILDRYRAAAPRDAPYWFNERASVSTLAAGAWACGGVSLEEYSSRKGKRQLSAGRADLWIRTSSCSYSLEAKQLFRSFRGHTCVTAASEWLEWAAEDARKIQRSEARKRGGVLFLAPYVRRGYAAEFKAGAWVEGLLKEVDHDFAAWWFCRPGTTPPTSIDKSSGWHAYYPGVILLGRFV